MKRPTAEEVIAAVKGLPDATALKAVLAAGGDPNAKVEGRPALDWAVTLLYEEKLRLLLSHGANPNLHEDPDSSNDGRFVTPLIVATGGDKFINIVRLLLAAGADPNQRDSIGMTPLMCAARWRAKGIVDLLLEAGAIPTLATDQGQTALFFAMSRDNPEIVRQLVQLGLDPDKPIKGGLSPAQYAQQRNHVGTLAVLRELAGSNPDSSK